MQINIITNIDQIKVNEWNAMVGNSNPFIRHEFLLALEKHQCVGEDFGWIPRHIVAFNNNQQIVGAIPLYLKYNSYGEFVFDWGWADAYHRAGLNYYPKLVCTTPYTPATGPRILTAKDSDHQQISALLINTALALADEHKASSLHWLFTSKPDTEILVHHEFMLRQGYQFHWTNNKYNNFEDFLARLNSKNRKKIKRERKLVHEADITFKILEGRLITEDQWRIFHRFYQSTFNRLGGYATLCLEFFIEIGKTMPDQVLLVLAEKDDKTIAGAFSMRDENTLYGRHWGCEAKYNNVHFEACYYQGIDYCIKQGLKTFEPGAQGEHKLSRGFLPTRTYSTHWIRHPGFRDAIAEFLEQETQGIDMYIKDLLEHSPYKSTEKATH